jgi:putative oxidoreductase
MTVGGLSLAIGIWPDIGALMIAAFLIPAAAWFHRFCLVDEPTQRQFQ